MIKYSLSLLKALTLSCAVTLGMAAIVPGEASAATFVLDGKPSKTEQPDDAHYRAFLAGLEKYQKASKSERPAILKALREHAESIKTDMANLLVKLKENKELDAFERAAYEQAKLDGVIKEVKAAGGTVAMLANVSASLDKELASLASDGSAPKSDLGVPDADPEVGGHYGCMAFYWAITFGFGHKIAYHACLKDTE